MTYAKTWRMTRSKWRRGLFPSGLEPITDEKNIFDIRSAPITCSVLRLLV